MSNMSFPGPCNFKFKIFKCVVTSARNAKSHNQLLSLSSAIHFPLSIMNISILSRKSKNRFKTFPRLNHRIWLWYTTSLYSASEEKILLSMIKAIRINKINSFYYNRHNIFETYNFSTKSLLMNNN